MAEYKCTNNELLMVKKTLTLFILKPIVSFDDDNYHRFGTKHMNFKDHVNFKFTVFVRVLHSSILMIYTHLSSLIF